MKVILVSEDVLYSKRLSVLLNRTSLLPCKIQNSSEVSDLSTTIKDCNLILLDFKFLKNENLDIKNLDKEKVLFLTEEEYIQTDLLDIKQENIIYKYQSYKNIASKLLAKLSEIEHIDIIKTLTLSKIISIYSPINRIAKSLFCKHIAKLISKQSKILLISFDLYSEFEEDETGQASLSEFLHIYIKSNFNITAIKKTIYKQDNLHIIKSFFHIDDIYSLKEEDYISLLKKIAGSMDYEYIIIDLAGMSFSLGAIMNLSYKFIIPYTEDRYNNIKLNKFKALLKEELSIYKEKISYLKIEENTNIEDKAKIFIKEELGEKI